MNADAPVIGRRVIVTGLAGSGKSTLSKALTSATSLPLIHLDLEFWQPGWVAPSDDEWRQRQHEVLAADEWIADGNYHETLDLRVARADTIIVLDMPWYLCSARALRRGLRRGGGVMPEGCKDSAWRRLRDEWRIAGRMWRNRRTEPETEREIIAAHGHHATVHVLRSRAEADAFMSRIDAEPRR